MESELLITAERILEDYGDEMRARARRILMSASDAEDAVQETLLTILSAPHMLRGIDHLGGWLFTLVTRRSIDIIRRDSRRKAREAEADADGQGTEDVPSPGELLDRDEAAIALTEAVEALPEKLKQPFVLNALEGMTFEEMSRCTGIPMGTLLSRKKKAQDRIRIALRKQGFEL